MSALSVIILETGQPARLLGYVAPRPLQATKILAAPECPLCSKPVYRLTSATEKSLTNYVLCKDCAKLFRFPFPPKGGAEKAEEPIAVKVTPQTLEEVTAELNRYRQWFTSAGRRPPL